MWGCGAARGAVAVTSTRISNRQAAAAGYAIATPTLPLRPPPPPWPSLQVEFSRRLARGAGSGPSLRLAKRRSQRRAGVWVWRRVLRGGAGAAAEGGGALGCCGPVPAAAARVTQIAGKDPRDRWGPGPVAPDTKWLLHELAQRASHPTAPRVGASGKRRMLQGATGPRAAVGVVCSATVTFLSPNHSSPGLPRWRGL